MTITAILFDIDGTLVDSNDQHVAAWRQAFSEAGHAFDAQTIHDQIGKGSDMLVPSLLPDLDEAEATSLGEAHGRIFKARYLPGIRPFAKAHDLLARAAGAGIRVVLASSASSEELDHYIDLLEAEALVAETTSADDVAQTKPAPDIFGVALEKIGPVDPAEVIVIGDTPYDIEAAAKCGIASIAVRSGGFPDAALREAGAIALYDDVAALLADFDTLERSRR